MGKVIDERPSPRRTITSTAVAVGNGQTKSKEGRECFQNERISVGLSSDKQRRALRRPKYDNLSEYLGLPTASRHLVRNWNGRGTCEANDKHETRWVVSTLFLGHRFDATQPTGLLNDADSNQNKYGIRSGRTCCSLSPANISRSFGELWAEPITCHEQRGRKLKHGYLGWSHSRCREFWDFTPYGVLCTSYDQS